MINCNNFEVKNEKDRAKTVVKGFCGRGAPTSTRLEVMVDTTVLSCLGYVTMVGMIVGDNGSRNDEKGVLLIQKGGICRSVDPLHQDNH